jgi:DNA-binding transcriptional ArsR family regulator
VVEVALATVAANRIDGDPVWTLLVGPPGGGKSEAINSVSGLFDVYPTATLTEAALLSGTPNREKHQTAKGGLLREINQFGIIACKDFGSVLSMNRDARAAVLAALREVYDGSWTRHVGTDGGKTLSWSGKVGLLAGCTPTIDRHHAVMGAMGERFCLYRLPPVDSDRQAREALGHAGREKTMREQLASAADTVLVNLGVPRERSDEETELLIRLATLVVRARSAVERDGYTREIELVPEPEAPTRLIIVLDRLLAGLDAIGSPRSRALGVVTKVALDSIPAIRYACLRALEPHDELDTNQVAEAIRYPSSTTRRALDDLTAHGLVDCERQTSNKAHKWRLSDFARERLARFPEMSVTAECLYFSRSACSTTNRESRAADPDDLFPNPDFDFG